ncbi:plasmid stabilization system protein ParE [Virgibacillus natechei]|uniref:Plasmid stabilization system protein ParE n=1 Tax=Virgibacillus natechei TaxID=1216297 RepID=A0ABS4IC90_9BACI|nr:type II toxin-antitoxin system RelE/ParE family toxin [Virgibacillus natechei]MBP1968518.1 plasmid stabilization system protein ParE [Virgibacillus natechei]UZD13633.1 type II toxin-antitoxin system RelE/ParE family toxin [Virgibacillus natechei]
MNKVVLSALARDKLKRYKSEYYTEDETREYLRKLSTELESLLLNPFPSKRYLEEQGKYKGVSRIVLHKFIFYYEKVDDEIIVLAVK